MSSKERKKRKTGNLAMIAIVEVYLALTIVASEDPQVLQEVAEAVISAAAVAPKVAKEVETTSEEMLVVVATDLIAQAGIAGDRDTEQL